MMLYFALLTALVSTVLKTNVVANPPVGKLKCYDQVSLTGNSFETTYSEPDLPWSLPDNFTSIASCKITGIWLLFNNTGYTGKVRAISGDDTTYEPTGLDIKSVFFIGDSNTEDQLLLYRLPDFVYKWPVNIKDTTSSFSQTLPIKSMILIGKSDFTIVSKCHTLCKDECLYCIKANGDGATFLPQLKNIVINETIEIFKGHCSKDILTGRKSLREDCGCQNVPGILDKNLPDCDKDNNCVCKFPEHKTGKCTCMVGYFNKSDKCEPCGCSKTGSLSNLCDRVTHKCSCKVVSNEPEYMGRTCCVRKAQNRPPRYNIRRSYMGSNATECQQRCKVSFICNYWSFAKYRGMSRGYCVLDSKFGSLKSGGGLVEFSLFGAKDCVPEGI